MAAFTTTADESRKDVVRCYVKGAAPAVMSHAATALSAGTSIPWDEELRTKAQANVQRMGENGLRVMAAGFRDIDAASFDPDGDLLGYVDGLEITSLVGMVDPPRAESKQAVADAQKAHIRVRMVTGDDVVTGAAIAKELGIDGEAILGAEFAALDESARLERIDTIGVVGRVAPEHKVLLVDTLKKNGELVAMTGDGVNDAPSIKAAHIGIAMGSGTEVAKNAGRMILTDDNFATIVVAVEQGRKLYDNLTKYVRFVLDFAGRVRPHVPRRDAPEHRRGAALHPAASAVDPLLHQRSVRCRARPGSGDPGPDAAAAAAEHRIDHDRRREADLRPGGPVHGDRASTR